jgi:hypothetical protein
MLYSSSFLHQITFMIYIYMYNLGGSLGVNIYSYKRFFINHSFGFFLRYFIIILCIILCIISFYLFMIVYTLYALIIQLNMD